MLFDILIELIGTIAGGWGSAITIGDHTPQTFATAALVALFIAETRPMDLQSHSYPANRPEIATP